MAAANGVAYRQIAVSEERKTYHCGGGRGAGVAGGATPPLQNRREQAPALQRWRRLGEVTKRGAPHPPQAVPLLLTGEGFAGDGARDDTETLPYDGAADRVGCETGDFTSSTACEERGKSMDFAYYTNNCRIGSTICTSMRQLCSRIVKGAIFKTVIRYSES